MRRLHGMKVTDLTWDVLTTDLDLCSIASLAAALHTHSNLPLKMQKLCAYYDDAIYDDAIFSP
jgi:hypothetical protein